MVGKVWKMNDSLANLFRFGESKGNDTASGEGHIRLVLLLL